MRPARVALMPRDLWSVDLQPGSLSPGRRCRRSRAYCAAAFAATSRATTRCNLSSIESEKRADCGRASDSLLEERRFMERRLLPLCVFFVATILCAQTGACSASAQEPAQTREGIITTFAPVVEKVAPSVVTVFTTQTVSRGLTAFPFSDDTFRQFFGGRLPQQGKQTLQGLG